MHLFDLNAGIMSSVPIVGSSIPLAAGSALNDKIDKAENITSVFFGDAAIEEGVFHETMNFASLYNLPIVFVCENNFYSCYTHLNERQPKRSKGHIPPCCSGAASARRSLGQFSTCI